VVEVENIDALFLRDFAVFGATVGPGVSSQESCERQYMLTTEVTGGQEVIPSTGVWDTTACVPGEFCLADCTNLPNRIVTRPQVPAGSPVRFFAPAMPDSLLTVYLEEEPIPNPD
jgi:hypothetical protein